MNFTLAGLIALEAPSKSFVTYHDSKCPYLKLYVTSSGTKSFFIQKKIKGKARRIVIGSLNLFSIEQARKEAIRLSGIIASGNDPEDQKKLERLNTLTLGQHFYDYIERHGKLRKKSWEKDFSEINRHLSHWFSSKLTDITKNDIQRLHEKIGSENGIYAANTILKHLRGMYNKAIEWEWKGTNPTIGIKKFRETSRDRFILPTEMKYFLSALEEVECDTFKDYFKILLLTGVRKTNGLMMRWEQIDLKEKVWRIPTTKNGDPIIVPLVEEIIFILQRRKNKSTSNWVFPQEYDDDKHITTPTKPWKNLTARATFKMWNDNSSNRSWYESKINKMIWYVSDANKMRRFIKILEKDHLQFPTMFDLTIHDLRRTYGSFQALNGTSLPVIGKSLGHKDMRSTQIYARLLIEPVRDAVNSATKNILSYNQ